MIEGRLVRLRASEPADAERYLVWLNDPDVTRGLTARYPMSRARELEFIGNAHTPAYTEALFAVDTLDGRHIGGAGLHGGVPEHRTSEIGLLIGEKSLWGKGYGADLVRTLCRFGFDEMNLHKITLFVHATNPRARRLYERLGFVVEGVAREAWYQHGEYVDLVHMGLFPDELRMEDE